MHPATIKRKSVLVKLHKIAVILRWHHINYLPLLLKKTGSKNLWVCFFWVARVRSGRSGQGRQLPALRMKMHQEVVYAISKPLRNRITDLLFLLCSGSGSPGRARRVGLAGLASPGRALARVPGQSRVRVAPGGVPKNRHWK